MIIPPTPLDNILDTILNKIVKESKVGTNRSDVIRWGINSLKNRPNGFHYEPDKPMEFKSPSVVIDADMNEFLLSRKKRFGIPVTQSIRDAIYSAYLDHKDNK